MSNGLRIAEERIAPDEAATTAEFIAFLEEATLRRHPSGPIRRFNQGRQTACVSAEFSVEAELADEHRVGLFAQPGTHSAVIRFANASSSSDRERDVRGMTVSLSNVPGANLTRGAARQDFLLNSHPVMVAPDPKEFLALLRALEAGGLRRVLYFAGHPSAARIGFASRQRHTCHLDIPYWSTTPYLFGDGRAVKYIARPASDRTSTMPSRPGDSYLRDAIRERLAEADAWFDFMIQFQTDADRMPIEDASVDWKQTESPYIRIARIRIPMQLLDAAAELACEADAFSPWHCLVQHRPLGAMNRARRDIYRALAALRQGRAAV